MLFTSLVFISFFLPFVIIGYILIPKRFKNLFLLISSLIFYAWGELGYVFLMLGTIALNYGCSLLITRGRRKLGVSLAVIISLALLFYFKYAAFAYSNIIDLMQALGLSEGYHKIPRIVLPLGISFYTFQVLSYTIDVYRGTIHANKSFLNFATYVTLFPHLIAGPIVRYAHIESQLTEKKLSSKRVAEGVERFIIGLVKKMFIANICAEMADTIFDVDPSFSSPSMIWIAAIAYTLQIYFDFSAYSDMAIGIAKILGFDFHENFNYPYIANSIKEFWRRWHISLSTWFRDYLYIPLGGSRVSTPKIYRNLLIVFLCTGLWHGASWSFIFWGLWHGTFLVLERVGLNKILEKLPLPFQHVYTLLVITIGWVFFRVEKFTDAVCFIKRMFFLDTRYEDIIYSIESFVNTKHIIILLIGLIFSLPLFKIARERFQMQVDKCNFLVIPYYGILIMFVVFILSMLSVGTYNPFIYFRF